jgi:hypothetical protein
MKMTSLLLVGICLFMAYLISGGVSGQTQLPGPPCEGDERLVAPLVNAGISLNPTSLIQALQNEEIIIASRAALALSRFPKHQEIVEALNLASQDKRETVAISAIRSLIKVNENGWVPSAMERLPIMRDRVVQIQLAGLLAQIGHADGWPIVISAVSDEKMALVALEHVAYFDRLKDQSGRSIDVAAELNMLLVRAPDPIRKQIEEKLAHLKK